MLQGGREGIFSAAASRDADSSWTELTEPDKKPARIALWERGVTTGCLTNENERESMWNGCLNEGVYINLASIKWDSYGNR